LGVDQGLVDVIDRLLNGVILPNQKCTHGSIGDYEIKKQYFVRKRFG